MGSCEYYEALSAELGCPTDGYLLNFAANFCYQFEAGKEKFSAEGQTFLDGTKQCLQEKLEATPSLNCNTIAEVAGKNHATCYLQNNFCHLGLSDQFNLFKIALPSLLDPALASTGRAIVPECIRQNLSGR